MTQTHLHHYYFDLSESVCAQMSAIPLIAHDSCVNMRDISTAGQS